MKKLFTFYIALLSLTSVCIFADESVDLFIVAGQSNASGTPITTERPYPNDDLDNDILLSYAYGSTDSVAGKDCADRNITIGGQLSTRSPWGAMRPQGTLFGPEVSFARKLKDSGFNPAIFKFALGSTSLVHNWTPGHPGRLTSSMLGHLADAIEELESDGYHVNVRGMVWVQGESDSHCQSDIDQYENAFTTLRNLIKHELDVDTLPTVIGYNDVAWSAVPGGVVPVMTSLSNSNNDISMHLFSDGPNKYDDYLYDKVHLDTTGRIIHGENVFDALIGTMETIPLYHKYEMSVANIDEVINGDLNPFDKSDVELRATFTSPSGKKHTINGFYFQQYHIETQHFVYHPAMPRMDSQQALIVDTLPDWKIRFSPDEVGPWSIEYQFIVEGATQSTPVTSFFEAVALEQDKKGFVVTDNSSHLSYEDDTPYFPVGINVGVVPEWNSVQPLENFYDTYFQRLNENGANHVRVWMDFIGGLSLLHFIDGEPYLRKFNLRDAYVFDKIIESAERHNIKLQLTLFTANNFATESSSGDDFWSYFSPFSAQFDTIHSHLPDVNGPCQTREDFFDPNNEARQIQQNYIRYIIDRYGYSTSVVMWEFFNEYGLMHNIDWDSSHENIRDWHLDMYNFVKQYDHKPRAVTTSSAQLYRVLDFNDDNPDNDVVILGQYSDEVINSFIAAERAMDVVQLHRYTNEWDHRHQNTSNVLSNTLKSYRKPVLFGDDKLISIAEFGPLDNTCANLNGKYQVHDPNGISQRNAIWETFFAGAYGTLNWQWYDFIERNAFEHHATPFMQHFQRFSDFIEDGLVPYTTSSFHHDQFNVVEQDSGLDIIYRVSGSQISGYVQRNAMKINNLIESYSGEPDCTGTMHSYVYSLDPTEIRSMWPCLTDNIFEPITIENTLGLANVTVTWYDSETGNIVEQIEDVQFKGEQVEIPLPTEICGKTYGDLIFVVEKTGRLIAQLQHDLGGTCLYLPDQNNGGTVKGAQCSTQNTMNWEIEDLGNNEVRIRNPITNSCLYSHNSDGSRVAHWGCWSDPNFVYIREPLFDGVRYRHKQTNKCLYVNGAGTAKSWGCWSDPNMVFHELP